MISLANLALPWDKETVMETKEMRSRDTGNSKATGASGLEDRATEKERGGKDPGAPARARSGSRCCISGQGQEPCGHLGYPKSE